MQRLLLLGTCAALRPTPAPRHVVRRYSTTEETTKFAGDHGPADSEAWLARQGLVQPGASPEIHEIARKARRKKRDRLSRYGRKKQGGATPTKSETCPSRAAGRNHGNEAPPQRTQLSGEKA